MGAGLRVWDGVAPPGALGGAPLVGIEGKSAAIGTRVPGTTVHEHRSALPNAELTLQSPEGVEHSYVKKPTSF